jgi:hypothetical protein
MMRSMLNLTAAASTGVEEDVLLQLERVRESVGRDVPRFGGVADEPAVGRDVDEAAPDVHRDPHHFVAGRRVKVEVRDLVAVRDVQDAAAPGGLGFAYERRGRAHQAEDDRAEQ